MGKLEAWARSHKGLVALLATLAAAIPVALYLLHRNSVSQGGQGLISYIPTAQTPQPDASAGGAATAPSGSDGSAAPSAGPSLPWGIHLPNVDISQSGSTFSVWGDPTAPWNTGLAGVGGNWNTPQGVWEWLQSVFAYYGLGPPPASGTLITYGPNGQVVQHHFQSPVAPNYSPVPSVPLAPRGATQLFPNGPTITLKQTTSNVPQSSRRMSGVG